MPELDDGAKRALAIVKENCQTDRKDLQDRKSGVKKHSNFALNLADIDWVQIIYNLIQN